MKNFAEWISVKENCRQISPADIQVLYHELKSHEVSIKGNGIFSLTYSMVASVNLILDTATQI